MDVGVDEEDGTYHCEGEPDYLYPTVAFLVKDETLLTTWTVTL